MMYVSLDALFEESPKVGLTPDGMRVLIRAPDLYLTMSFDEAQQLARDISKTVAKAREPQEAQT